MLHFMGVLLEVREKKEFLTGGEGIQKKITHLTKWRGIVWKYNPVGLIGQYVSSVGLWVASNQSC